MARAYRSVYPRVRMKGSGEYLPVYRGEGPFDGASQGRRLRGWSPGVTGPNSAITAGIQTIRDRSRDLTRKVPLVASAYRKLVANVVGVGFIPKSKAPSEEFRAATKEAWETWARECDADGRLAFPAMLALAFRGMVEAGEVFIRHRNRYPEDGLLVPYQVQLLEAEMVPAEKNERLSNGGYILAGIEFDAIGRRVAYHMHRNHPGDAILAGDLQTVRVPASEVIHLYHITRPGQVRGEPWAAPAIVKIREWMEYDEAELVRKKAAANHVGYITSAAPDEILNEDEGDAEADLGEALARMEPGTIVKLLPGEDVTFSQPAESGNSYEPFVKGVLRQIAQVLSVTYEQLTGDLSGVNFSSIRAGLNDAQSVWRVVQADLVKQVCEPIWARFLEAGILAGVIPSAGFMANRRAMSKAEWQLPGWRYVNPVDEIKAKKEEIRAGLNTRANVAAELGRDIEEIDAELARDAKRAAELGLVFDIDPTLGKGVVEPAAGDAPSDGEAADKSGRQ